MHYKIITNIISRILLFFSFFLLLPLLWAISYDVASPETRAFILTIIISLVLSLFLRTITHTDPKSFENMNAKDGLSIVGLSWIIVSVIGALPFYISHSVPSFTDAFFETVSGFTTTGASILTDIESFPRGLLFWRSLTHWIGGMGLIVLYLAILPYLGSNAYQLY